jgi:hypothetical protein
LDPFVHIDHPLIDRPVNLAEWVDRDGLRVILASLGWMTAHGPPTARLTIMCH